MGDEEGCGGGGGMRVALPGIFAGLGLVPWDCIERTGVRGKRKTLVLLNRRFTRENVYKDGKLECQGEPLYVIFLTPEGSSRP